MVEEFLEFLRFGGKSELAGMGSMSSSGSFDGFAMFHLSRENGNWKAGEYISVIFVIHAK